MPEITKDMISYEDAEIVVTVDGDRYRVDFESDLESTPFDDDCYSEDDIQAWRNSDWEYVGVIVTPLDVPESEQFSLSDSLWGVVFGSYTWNAGTVHESHADTTYICTVHPVPEMVDEVARNVQSWRASEAYKSYVLS